MNKKEQLTEIMGYIPSAAQTLSKYPGQFVVGVSPVAIERAEGAYLYDTDGKKYLDLMLALGPMVFGYANKRIDGAVKQQLDKGTIYSVPAAIELKLAKVIREVVPCGEMSRFVLNGNDATSGAIRLARYITKRDHVAKCGYHGCQDWSICTKEGRNHGVPEVIKTMTHDFMYNDIASLEKIFNDYPGQIAAVILEPVGSEKPIDNFLNKVKEVAHKHGAILIFDEMVTGFRWALGGAQEYFGVVPDLACFGKAISGGLPLAVICGKSEYMKRMDEVFVSMTFGGYTLGIVAALECIAMMREYGDVHTHMHELGDYFIREFNATAKAAAVPVSMVGYGPHPTVQVGIKDDYLSRVFKTFIYQEFHEAGIFFSASMMIGYVHTREMIDEVLGQFKRICEQLRGVQDFATLLPRLKGEVIAPRTVRSQQ